MFLYTADIIEATSVFLFHGRKNSDEDFEAYLEAIQKLDKRAEGRDSSLIQVVDEENAAPNALWRRRIAEATRSVKSKPDFVLVTTSPMQRGVLMALNWLRPPPFAFNAESRFEDAVRWCERRRGRPLPSLPSLYREARELAQTRVRA